MNVIGIDLGTTNSVVSIYKRGAVKTLEIYGRKATPSVVSRVPPDGRMLVGAAAKKRVLIDPATSVVSNKRFMGDRGKTHSILGTSYTPVNIASYIIKHLVDGASETLGEKVTRAVVTVPAYFNQNQKEDTKNAAEKAGLEVLMLQAEPTAAAIAYGFNQEKDQTLLVYDLGGGTFDVSILEVKGNDFMVRAIGGDAFLGGDNFDEAILDDFYKDLLSEHGVDLKTDRRPEARTARQQLKELAEQAKIELTNVKRTEICIPSFIYAGSYEREFTRARMETLIMPFVLQTIKIMRDTMRDANVSPDDINRVVCVGGSTKIPLISEIIAKEIKTPHRAENVDEIVAMGAAITAASLHAPVKEEADYRPIELNATNVTPFDLGIRLENDKFGVLIPKNSPLPALKRKEFTTTMDYARQTDVVVFQGANELCSNNSQLGGFALKGIQKAKKSVPRIEVEFHLDESDILEIEARDSSTKSAGRITIERFVPKPWEPEQKGISLDEIRIGVSEVGCDDMGAVLEKMGFRWSLLKDPDFSRSDVVEQHDIIFINCCKGGLASSNKTALKKFVENGGILYVSDLSASQISEAFPGKIVFGSGGESPQTVSAGIVDKDVRASLNKMNVTIHFDMPVWVPVTSVAAGVDIYLEANVKCADMGLRKRPLMVGFSHGDGHVIYTAFHNHTQTSKEEAELLKLIALKPISVASDTPLVELARSKAT